LSLEAARAKNSADGTLHRCTSQFHRLEHLVDFPIEELRKYIDGHSSFLSGNERQIPQILNDENKAKKPGSYTPTPT
jgi:hypothetical protein